MTTDSIGYEPSQVYSVSSLNQEVKFLLENNYSEIWIEGEISNLAQPASGHIYFSLKDDRAQIRCALFRGNINRALSRPQNGLQILARGRLSLYENRGDYQFIVQYIEQAGEGALRRAFELLKHKLADEGLFENKHKIELPELPRKVGIVTSPTGAAIRDIITTFKRRFPGISLIVYPVPVQGEGAGDEIAAMLETAERHAECDVLILARGGGSLEDLWAFNEEQVARAIFKSTIPIVTGVGHEIDFTIADLTADYRAATPTAAAEILSPDQQELLSNLQLQQSRLHSLIQGKLNNVSQSLDWISSRLIHPRTQLENLGHRIEEKQKNLQLRICNQIQLYHLNLSRLDSRLQHQSPLAQIKRHGLVIQSLAGRLNHTNQSTLVKYQDSLRHISTRLNTINPTATLERGYAIIRTVPDHNLIRRTDKVTQGDQVEAQLADGKLNCTVNSVLD